MHFCNGCCDCLGQPSQVFFVKLIRRRVVPFFHSRFLILTFPNFSFPTLISCFLPQIFSSHTQIFIIILNLTPKIFISHSILSIALAFVPPSSQSLPSPPRSVSTVILLHRSPLLYSSDVSSITDLNF